MPGQHIIVIVTDQGDPVVCILVWCMELVTLYIDNKPCDTFIFACMLIQCIVQLLSLQFVYPNFYKFVIWTHLVFIFVYPSEIRLINPLVVFRLIRNSYNRF